MTISISTVAGIELARRTGDSVRHLVMLHGIGSNRRSFDPLFEALPADIDMIAWNAPGYGRSEPLTVEYPLALDYAHKLHDVVQALGLTSFTLLGHSLGTLIATAYAAHYPERIERLVLLACAQGHGMRTGQPLPASAQQRLTDLDALGREAFAKSRAPRLLHDAENHPAALAAAIDAMASINPDGYRQAVAMLAAGDLRGMAAEVKADSLTIVGCEDQITAPKLSRDCHQALQAAAAKMRHRHIEIPAAGHLVHQQQPAQVADHIAEFCGWRDKA